MQDLPPVPEIEAVLAPNQVPQEVGFVSSVSHSERAASFKLLSRE